MKKLLITIFAIILLAGCTAKVSDVQIQEIKNEVEKSIVNEYDLNNISLLDGEVFAGATQFRLMRQATITSDIYPSLPNTYDSGTVELPWKDLNVGSNATITDELIIGGDTQAYKMYTIESGTADGYMPIQGQTSGADVSVGIGTKDGDGTDDVSLAILGVGEYDDFSNFESVVLGWNVTTGIYELTTDASGTGTVRDLDIYTGANTGQIYLDSTGDVRIPNLYSTSTSMTNATVTNHFYSTGDTDLATTTIGSADQYFQFDTQAITGYGNFPIVRPMGGALGIGTWADALSIVDTEDDDEDSIFFIKTDASSSGRITFDYTVEEFTIDTATAIQGDLELDEGNLYLKNGSADPFISLQNDDNTASSTITYDTSDNNLLFENATSYLFDNDLVVTGNSTTTGDLKVEGNTYLLGPDVYLRNDGNPNFHIQNSDASKQTGFLFNLATEALEFSGASGGYSFDADTVFTGWATTTSGLFTQSDGHFGGNLTVDGNATTTNDSYVGDRLKIGGTQEYNIYEDGTVLYVQGQTSGASSIMGFTSKDSDGTDLVALGIFGENDFAGNNHILVFGWDNTEDRYNIETQENGTGVAKNLYMEADDVGGSLELKVDNTIAMGGNLTITGNATTTGHFNADSTLYVKNSKVGIGTTTPKYLFSIESQNDSDSLLQVTTSTNQNILIVNSDGNIGIGTSNPGVGLEVMGDVTLDGDVVFSPLSADYIISGRVQALTFARQTAGESANFEFFSEDGDGTDNVTFDVYGVGTDNVGGIVNREKMQFGWNVPGGYYRLFTEADGTGTLRQLRLFTEGHASQLVLETDGSVGIGTNSPDALLEVNGDTILGGNATTTGNLVVSSNTSLATTTIGNTNVYASHETLNVAGVGDFPYIVGHANAPALGGALNALGTADNFGLFDKDGDDESSILFAKEDFSNSVDLTANFTDNRLELNWDFTPATGESNTYDLGVSGLEWRNLWVDGIANLDETRAGNLHATTTDFDALMVNGNATTTGSLYVGDRVSIGTQESYHALSIGNYTMILNSEYGNGDAIIFFGNISSPNEDKFTLDNWDTEYFNDTGQTFVTSDDLYVDGRIKTANSLFVNASSTLNGTSTIGFQDSGEYMEVRKYSIGDAGGGDNDAPMLSFFNNASNFDNYAGIINNGLFIMDDIYTDDTFPSLQFAADNITDIAGGASAYIEYNTTTDAMNFVDADGYFFDSNVRVATTTGDQALNVEGFVLADGYLEYSKKYDGDALAEIKDIKCETGSIRVDDWCEIDHESLPDGVKFIDMVTKHRLIGYENKKNTFGIIEQVPVYEEFEEEVTYRNMSAQVQFNLKATQQLLEEIETLKVEIEKLKTVKSEIDNVNNTNVDNTNVDNTNVDNTNVDKVSLWSKIINWIINLF